MGNGDGTLAGIFMLIWIAVIMFGAYTGGTHEGKIKELEKRVERLECRRCSLKHRNSHAKPVQTWGHDTWLL